MTSFKKLAVALGACGLLVAAGASHALPTLKFKDGATTYTVDPFGGIDWNSAATAVADTAIPNGVSQFSTTYLANAVGIKLVGGAGAIALTGTAADAYEFTIKVTLVETALCANIACSQVDFTVVSGSYDIYYDSVADSNLTTGAGFTDGTKIISGSLTSGSGFYLPAFNFGSFNFSGGVSFTNTNGATDAYFYPELDTSTATATLQIGTTNTAWTKPTSWIDGGYPAAIPADKLIFQADGNQSFTAKTVPEPASLALVGLSLLGVAAASRRRRQ